MIELNEINNSISLSNLKHTIGNAMNPYTWVFLQNYGNSLSQTNIRHMSVHAKLNLNRSS